MLKFENPHNGRYYYIYVEKDLLGHHLLVIIRGGNHTRRMLRAGFICDSALRREIERLSKRRLQRGYVLKE